VVLLKIQVFWHVMLYNWASCSQHFQKQYYLHLQGQVVKEDWLANALGTIILWNVWNYSPNDTVSHHRRLVLLSATITEIRPM